MSATWDSKNLKATPLTADEVLIIDTADSRNQKRATISSLVVATPWSRNAGSGFIFPSTLTDKVGIGLNNPSEMLDVLGNAKIRGNVTVNPDNTAGVNLTDLTIFQSLLDTKKGLTFSGDGLSGNSTTDGVVLLAGNILPGNMQLWVGQRSDLGNPIKNFFRLTGGGAVPNIGGVNGNNTVNTSISLGNEFGSRTGFGISVITGVQGDIQAQAHILAANNTIGLIVQQRNTSTDIIQLRNSAGTVLTRFDNLGALDMNSKKITEVTDPTVAQDAATKNYVDTHTTNGLWSKATTSGALSATVAAGGTGYTIGDDITVVGGTGTASVFNVDAVSSGVVTAVSLIIAGAYTVKPTNPVSTTGGTGTGCTLTVTFDADSVIIFPTVTADRVRITNATASRPAYSFLNGTAYGMHFDSVTPSLAFSAGGFDVLKLVSPANSENFLTITGAPTTIGDDHILINAVGTGTDIGIIIQAKGTGGDVEINTSATSGSVTIGRNELAIFDNDGGVAFGDFNTASNLLGLVIQSRAATSFTQTITQIQSPNAGRKFDIVVANEITTVNASLGVTNSNTFSRSSGSFVTDGFLAGQTITSTGFTNSQNNGMFVLASVSTLALTITTTPLIAEGITTGRKIAELSAGDVTLITNGQEMHFDTVAGEALRLADKKVGIGVTPVVPLHVRSSDAGTLTLNADADEFVLENKGNIGYTVAPTVVISPPVTPVTATATSSITAGIVTLITITNSGSGYVTTPIVTISGGGGSGATATATLVNTEVTVITITAGGTGYTSAPTVALTAAPAAVTATGTANISGGKVVSVTITNGGVGYKVPPALVQFIGGDGNGVGTDAVTVSGSAVTLITVTKGGTGLSIVSDSDQVGVISFTHGGTTEQTASIVQDHSTERMRFLQSGQQGLIIDSLGHVAVSQDNVDHPQVFTVDTDILNVPVRILVRDSLDRLMLGYNGSDTFVTNAIQAQVIVQTDSTDLSIASSGNAASKLRFYTSSGVSLTEQMRIASNGNVGIGLTADATTKLEVDNRIKITGPFGGSGSANLELDGHFTASFQMREGDAIDASRRWITTVDNGVMTHSIANEAVSVNTAYMKLTRSGTTMTDIAFTSTKASFSGNFGIGEINPVTLFHVKSVAADTTPITAIQSTGTNLGITKTFVGNRNPNTFVTGSGGEEYIRDSAATSGSYESLEATTGTNWFKRSLNPDTINEILTGAQFEDLATAGVITQADATRTIKFKTSITPFTSTRFSISGITGGLKITDEGKGNSYTYVNPLPLFTLVGGDLVTERISFINGIPGTDFLDYQGRTVGVLTDQLDLRNTIIIGFDLGSFRRLSAGIKGPTLIWRDSTIVNYTDSLTLDGVSVISIQGLPVASSTGVSSNKPVIIIKDSAHRPGSQAQIENSAGDLLAGETLVRIDAGIPNDQTILIRNSQINTPSGIFDVSGTTGNFTVVANNSIAATAITSVTNNSGVAVFNHAGTSPLLGSTVTISGFTTNTAYNQTGIVTLTTATTFEVDFIAFGSTETGSYLVNGVTITATAHGLTGIGTGVTLDTTLATDYDGGELIYNIQTNSFDIAATFTSTKAGTWSTKGLDQHDPRVLAIGNPGTKDSKAIAFGSVNGNTVATVISNGAYVPIVVTSLVSNSLITQGFKLINIILAIWEYTRKEPFEGTLTGGLWAIKTGSTQKYRFAMSTNGAVPVFASASFSPMTVKTDEVSIPLDYVVNLNQGDTIQLFGAGDGTGDNLTITDLRMDIKQ